MSPENRESETLTPAEIVRIEAAALELLARRLDDPSGPARKAFDAAVELIANAVDGGRRVVLTGIGKSGLIARKIAATMVSLGTPAVFMHAADAAHGDLGLLERNDVLLALSYSGQTDELLRLLSVLPQIRVSMIAITGRPDSTLASASVCVLDCSVEREACAHQLAPTASTTAMLALGDALAVALSRRLGFKPRDFAGLHPGGQLGKRLATVRQLMHAGDALPSVLPTAAMPQIIHEMSAKRLGITTVQSPGGDGPKLLGVLSDGDLRRLLERNGPAAFYKTAADIMNKQPRTIAPEPLAADALKLMEQHKITALVVTEDGSPTSKPLGILHIHDLWEKH